MTSGSGATMSDRLTDRVAQLAEEAESFLAFERLMAFTGPAGRKATRDMLARKARALGFPENEISAAIDTALGGR